MAMKQMTNVELDASDSWETVWMYNEMCDVSVVFLYIQFR